MENWFFISGEKVEVWVIHSLLVRENVRHFREGYPIKCRCSTSSGLEVKSEVAGACTGKNSFKTGGGGGSSKGRGGERVLGSFKIAEHSKKFQSQKTAAGCC